MECRFVLSAENLRIGSIIFFMIAAFSLKAQLPLSKDTVDILISRSPAFTIYKDNYFITGTTLIGSPTKLNSDVKFQVSLKYRLSNRPMWFGFYPYLSYTQKTFWDIYKKSAPFGESNYNPALFAVKPMFKENRLNSALMISLEHESNGKDTANGSRGWNYVAATYTRYLSSTVFSTIKLWIPFGYKGDPKKYWGNPELIHYIGYGEYRLDWQLQENKLAADFLLRKGWSWSWKGSLQVDISYRPSVKRNIYLIAQWFWGYSESLINYTEKQSNLRVGIVMKPSFHRFY